MKTAIEKIISFIPLFTFLMLSRFVTKNYRLIFIISAVLSAGALVIFKARHITLNRLNMGINYYLIGACIINLSGLSALSNLFEAMRGLGMIIFILITAAAATIITDSGFIGVKTKNMKLNLLFSIFLFTAALLCGVYMYFGIFVFNFHLVLTEVVPFVILFTFQGILQGILARLDS